MRFIRLLAGPLMIACGVIATGVASAAAEFPFDQELVLEAAPMRPGKRMPVLNVAPDGNARVDLWCKTVPAHVEVSDTAIKIEPAPLPEALPEMMGNGQCTPERIQADQDLLAVLAQSTAWRMQGSALVLDGAKPLKFRAASN
jgi:heat shock protein HslJ